MFGSNKDDKPDPTNDPTAPRDLPGEGSSPYAAHREPTLADEIRSGELPPTTDDDAGYGRDTGYGRDSGYGRDTGYDSGRLGGDTGYDGTQVRRDGVGPTDYEDDPTRTMAAVRGDGLSGDQRDAAAVGALGAADAHRDYRDDTDRTAMMPAATGQAGDGRYDDPYAAPSAAPSRYDTRPEDRFATGAVPADRDGDGVRDADEGVAKNGFHIPRLGGWLLGLVRILIGWQFLWAFLDKTFGLGFGTPSERSWINGGQPTQGFLGGVVEDPNNPFRPMFEYFQNQSWTDWLFMAGLLGIGIVLVLGLGKLLTWVAALSGAVLLLMMYLAAWPAGHSRGAVGAEGQAATNPFLDDHLLNAILLIALAACNAGAYLGLAKAWRTRHAVKDA